MNFVCNFPIFNNLNIPNIPFRSNTANYPVVTNPNGDSFVTNPLFENKDKAYLTQLAKSNPRIQEILRENNIPTEINIKELEKLQKGHLTDTRITAAKIYSALPQEMKENVNLSDLQQAAMLHDYGKIMIPDKILNKEGKLNPQEKKIMEAHSELGYELLKQQGVNPNVLNLVKYHHQQADGGGYPAITNDFVPDISLEILTASDKYCALREPRSYKPALSREEALDTMRADVSEEVYKALEKTSR